MSDRPAYIYALCEPGTEVAAGELPPPAAVRYVGVTIRPKARLREHCKDAGNTHRGHWVRGLIARGMMPAMLFLETVDEETWEGRERWWIAFYRAKGALLTNAADGGRGVLNPPPEVREKLADITREQWKDPDLRRKRMDRLLRALAAPEEKERKRRAQQAHAQTPEHRGRFEAEKAARWEDPSYRDRMTEVLREARQMQAEDPMFRERVAESNRRAKAEQWKDPEYRAMRSAVSSATLAKTRASSPDFAANNAAAVGAAAKASWADPEQRAARIAAMRATLSTPEARERKAAATKEAWADPERRARRAAAIKEGQKKAWADPEKKAARLAALQATREGNTTD